MIPKLSFQHDHIINTHSWPFHRGELEVQLKLGAYEYVNSYAPQFIRPHMPLQHRDFYANQPFLVAAARDEQGHMWSTLLFASNAATTPETADSFVTSPDPKTLIMNSSPLPGDALEGAMAVGSDLGLLGIEFATRRRNRVNGRIVSNDPKAMTFQVDQSFGNCPQYIKPREWWTANDASDPQKSDDSAVSTCDSPTNSDSTKLPRPNKLNMKQVKCVQEAETVFLATGYRAHGENPAYGNDAGHRGGAPGFLDVQDDHRTIILPDYNGNSHFNTIGNIYMDSSMGLTIPLYETGGMLQLSGQASIIWDDDERVARYAGAKRLIEFVVERINQLPDGSLPIRWNRGEGSTPLQITRKVVESEDVTSFYLSSVSGESPRLPAYQAGQHLPITLVTPKGQLERSYSLSSYDAAQKLQEYRISVKRHPNGAASNLLHQNMCVGDWLLAGRPSGSFVYPSDSANDDGRLVFLSAGIGVTPILSMLHAFVADSDTTRNAIWIHSAKDSDHYPFAKEVEDLQARAGDRLQRFVHFTRQVPNQVKNSTTTTVGQGRIDQELLEMALGVFDSSIDRKPFLQVFMCGPNSFVGSMETMLTNLGMDRSQIHHESF